MENIKIQQSPRVEVDINTLADIRDVVIDMSLPVEERRKSYLRQIRNPRLYRCEDTVVRVSFAEGGPSLEERLRQYLLSRPGMAL